MTPNTVFPIGSYSAYLTDRDATIRTLDQVHQSTAELHSRSLMDMRTQTVSVPSHSGAIRIEFAGVNLPATDLWLSAMVPGFRNVLNLQPNWDNDGASAVMVASIENALKGVFGFGANKGTVPGLTPTRSGGVQLEWHEQGMDLEITFEADGTGYAVFSDLADPSLDWDGPVSEKTGDLARLFSERLRRS